MGKELHESPARSWMSQEAQFTQFLTHKPTLLSMLNKQNFKRFSKPVAGAGNVHAQKVYKFLKSSKCCRMLQISRKIDENQGENLGL